MSEEKQVRLIECEACNHKVSEMAKACPQCGHPINAKDWSERVGDTISDIPKKLVERERTSPQSPYKKGAMTYFVMPIWIVYAIFAWVAIPTTDSRMLVIGVTAFLIWWLYFGKKPEQGDED